MSGKPRRQRADALNMARSMTPLRIPPLTEMKIPSGIGVAMPSPSRAQILRPPPRPIPRPINWQPPAKPVVPFDYAHLAATQPQRMAPPVRPSHHPAEPAHTPSAAPGSDAANTRGWLIGASALAVVMIGWLIWSWPSGGKASTASAQPPAQATVAVAPTTPQPAPPAITTTPAPQPQTRELQQPPTPAVAPVVSTWDELLSGNR